MMCEQEYKGGVRCITFPNGTRKEIRPAPASALEEGHTETVYFSNGDIKQVRKSSVYYRRGRLGCCGVETNRIEPAVFRMSA